MAMDSQVATLVGYALLGVVGEVFLILKLCGLISWAWVWIFAPFWIPSIICALGVQLALMMLLITGER